MDSCAKCVASETFFTCSLYMFLIGIQTAIILSFQSNHYEPLKLCLRASGVSEFKTEPALSVVNRLRDELHLDLKEKIACSPH